MKALFRVATALFTALLAQVVSCAYKDNVKVDNVTLIRCPDGPSDRYCIGQDRTVVYPSERHKPPGYKADFAFITLWDVQHLLTWNKKDDEPLNMTIKLGGYSMLKEITTERSLNFTFKEIAGQLLPKANQSTLEDRIIGTAAAYASANGIYFKFPDSSDSNISYIAGPDSFFVFQYFLYQYAIGEMRKQRAIGDHTARESLNKKWRIGVGVGVGVGVPLLMTATYYLGRRHKTDRKMPKKTSP